MPSITLPKSLKRFLEERYIAARESGQPEDVAHAVVFLAFRSQRVLFTAPRTFQFLRKTLHLCLERTEKVIMNVQVENPFAFVKLVEV